MKTTHLTIEVIGKFLKQLSQRSDYVHWLSTPNLERIEFISPVAFKKIWGRDCDILYHNPQVWIEYMHPKDSEKRNPIKNLAALIAEQGVNAKYEESYRIVRPDGEVRWILDRGFPVLDEENNCIGVTGVAIDVSSEKKREELLKAASRAKTEFIENMSHDIRTPITGAVGMIEGLLNLANETKERLTQNQALSFADQKELVETVGQYSNILMNSTDELLQLCNQILETVGLESGKVANTPTSFELKELIKHNVDLLQPVAQDCGIELSFEIDEKLPQYFKGLRTCLDRTVLNLASNALKFTEKGFVKIIASLGDKNSNNVPENHVPLKIAILDSGIGIPSDKFDAIFEHFSRLTPSHKGTYKGSGLGLYAVKQYIKAMEGQITVMSQQGKGSEFTVIVPLLPSDHSDHVKHSIKLVEPKRSEKRANTLEIADTTEENTGKGNILIVEDNPTAAIAIKIALKKYDCNVTLAENGAKGLAKAQEKRYDLILMDIGLPDTTGLEVTKNIRSLIDKKLASVPIVALTGHVNKKEECLAVGMQDLLNKPAQPLALDKILQQYVFSKETESADTIPEKTEFPEGKLSSDDELEVVDSDESLRMVGGNEETLNQLLSILDEDLKLTEATLDEGYKAQDVEKMRAELHRSLGGICYLRLPQLDYALRSFQTAIKRLPQNPDEVKATYAAMKKAFDAFQTYYASL